MGFWEDVKGFFNDAYHKVENIVTTVYNDVKTGASSVFHSFDDNTKSLLNTVKTDTGMAFTDVHELIDKGSETINHLGNNIQQTVVGVADDVPKTTESLSLPLIIGGAAALIYLMKK